MPADINTILRVAEKIDEKLARLIDEAYDWLVAALGSCEEYPQDTYYWLDKFVERIAELVKRHEKGGGK